MKNCFKRCGIAPQIKSSSEKDDLFADLDAETQNMSNLNVLLQQLQCGITAEDYVTHEEDLTTCFTSDGSRDTNWKENLRTSIVSDCDYAAGRPTLQVDDSIEEDEEMTSIQIYDTVLTLAKDLQLFLVCKGEQKASDALHRVISALEDAKLASKLYWSLVTGQVIRGRDGPITIQTKIGWVLSGPATPLETIVNLTLTSTHVLKNDTFALEPNSEDHLKRLWELESLGIIEDEASV